ncbi:MAG: hypothetical protein JW991_02010 [Candidatus Pacebacteria bacterium]|nr:hypothetical protein [Candidatus Paceibacterota bacterium]
MKFKLPVVFSFLLINFLIFTSPICAAEFKLNSIGALDVSSQIYSQMWYTGNQPTFSGTGTNGASVSVTLDGTSYSTTVNASEQWSWLPPEALANADHNLIFTSEGTTISFTLTTGSSGPSELGAPVSSETGTPAAMPTSGFLIPTLGVLGIGLGLIICPALRKPALFREV